MNNIDQQYKALLQDILDNGVEKKDRTGTGTLSVFGKQIRHKMSDGFPLLTTKKMAWKSIVTELIWFLRGDTNIKYLVDNDCYIWVGDAYKAYVRKWHKNFEGLKYDGQPLSRRDYIGFVNSQPLEILNLVGGFDLGPLYGKQWRSWGGDQITNLINDLKINPDSRRMMVSAWNVEDLDKMVLPPCHYGFQVYTREMSTKERNDWFQIHRNGNNPFMKSDWKDYELDQQNIPKRAISLMWNQRSVDTFLGLPFNIASYGLLLTLLAKEVNMVPDELIGNLGDTHLYLNHIEQAKEQIGREPFELPKLIIKSSNLNLDQVEIDYELQNYKCHSAIKAPLSN